MADILWQLAANLIPTVSGGAYQDIRKVITEWNARLKHRGSPEFRCQMHPVSPSTLFSPIFSLAREKMGPPEATGNCKSVTTSQSRLCRASSPERGAFLGGGTPALHIKQAARTSGCLLVLYRSSLYLPESKSDSVRVRRRLMASVRVCVSSGKRPEAMAVRIGRISYCAPSAPEPRSMRYSGV